MASVDAVATPRTRLPVPHNLFRRDAPRRSTCAATHSARGGASGDRTKVNDLNFDAASCKRHKTLGLGLKDVRTATATAGKQVPRNNNNTEFCLCFHIMGFCWSNCNRKEDHRKHQPGKRAHLCSWCDTCCRAGGPQ